MNEDDKNASEQSGSAANKDNGSGKSGETVAKVDLDQYVPKSQYDELEKKLGVQGNELGEFKTFYKDMGPLLDELDKQPELVEAIIQKKIDKTLVKSILEGKVSVGEAKAVTKANEEVKKDMGDKAYDKADPEVIEKMIASRMEEFRSELKGEVDQTKEELQQERLQREVEKDLDSFINRTPDYKDYADEVLQYIEDHNLDDIEVAYDAVKGKALAKLSEAGAEKARAEEAKRTATNAGGGHGSRGRAVTDDVKKYVAVGRNPNLL